MRLGMWWGYGCCCYVFGVDIRVGYVDIRVYFGVFEDFFFFGLIIMKWVFDFYDFRGGIVRKYFCLLIFWGVDSEVLV